MSRRTVHIVVVLAIVSVTSGCFFPFNSMVPWPPWSGWDKPEKNKRLEVDAETLAVRGMNAYTVGEHFVAFKNWKIAADKGNTESQANLGILYARGWGVLQDSRMAVYWWSVAAAKGHAQAQYHLGLAYIFGEGIGENFVEGYAWTWLAAGQGHAQARGALAAMDQRLPLDYRQAGIAKAKQYATMYN